jgi:hypothetical protein
MQSCLKIMPQNIRPNLLYLRVVLVTTLLLTMIAVYEFFWPVYESGILLSSRKWEAVLVLGVSGVGLEILLLCITATAWKDRLIHLLETLMRTLVRLRWFNLIIFLMLITLYSIAIFGPMGERFQSLAVRLSLFWVLALAGSFLLKAWSLTQADEFHRGWVELLAVAFIISAFSHQVASFVPNISTYPFTLGWSETSRYYYASLFFSKRIYGIFVPPTVLHPSRYLMQAVPFLLTNSPLWLHRAWQVFLWLMTSLLTAALLIRRLSIADRLLRWMLLLWIFLYLMIGPVYYHLLVPVVIILWGFNADPKHLSTRSTITSILAVLLASAWAGISRINWFPVPGLLAACLYLLEHPFKGRAQTRLASNWRAMLQYLYQPILYVIIGTATAFASQAAYIWWSGNPAEEFTTSFMSDLLWYRLLPNPTYPPGILLGVLLVSLPLILLALEKMISKRGGLPVWRYYHPFRWLGLAGALLVLLVGGIIVSVKIGGGSNLHNMDAYLVLLLVISAYLYFGIAVPDPQTSADTLSNSSQLPPQNSFAGPDRSNPHEDRQTSRLLHQSGLFMAVLIPIAFTLVSRTPTPPPPDAKDVAKSLNKVVSLVQETSQEGGEVLFISNRHLLTFHYVEGVALIPDYERVFLMEMAMAGNPDYLQKFREELKNQRFALIVSEPLYTRRKDESEIFGEENNAWVKQVSQYILRYYKEEELARQVHIQLLVPK